MKAMKIFSMMLMAALTLGFAACSDDDDIEVKDFKSGIAGTWLSMTPDYLDGGATVFYVFHPDAKPADDGYDGSVEEYVYPSEPFISNTIYNWRYIVSGSELRLNASGTYGDDGMWTRVVTCNITKMQSNRIRCTEAEGFEGSWRSVLSLVRVPSPTWGDWANDFDWDWAHEWDASKED